MPLKQPGMATHGSDIDRDVETTLDRLFSLIDTKVQEHAAELRLSQDQIRLLQPVHCCTLVGDAQVFVLLAAHDLGVVTTRQFTDWSGKEMDLDTGIFLVQRDLGFKDAFGFSFARDVLALDESNLESVAAQIAEEHIKAEIERAEHERRLVRISPVFQGRDFVQSDNLVFVLSPFEDPFDSIFADHIKPSVESISNLTCLRADDIYDNRPIIEDIWRYINESRVVVSELTGRNGNVFYETGIAHTVGKEVILITQSMDDVPFDLRHLRCIVYEYSPRGVKTLEENLKGTIRNVLSRTA